MPKSKLVGLLFESWNDFDRALEGVTEDEAVERHFGGSSFAWTYAHAANLIDAWVNVRFGTMAPHALIGQDRYRFGGTGEPGQWQAIRQGVKEVREAATTTWSTRRMRIWRSWCRTRALSSICDGAASVCAMHSTAQSRIITFIWVRSPASGTCWEKA